MGAAIHLYRHFRAGTVEIYDQRNDTMLTTKLPTQLSPLYPLPYPTFCRGAFISKRLASGHEMLSVMQLHIYFPKIAPLRFPDIGKIPSYSNSLRFAIAVLSACLNKPSFSPPPTFTSSKKRSSPNQISTVPNSGDQYLRWPGWGSLAWA